MSKPTRTYTLDDLIVEWRPELCCHCQNCHQGLPQVFNPEARPWVNLQGADPQEIRNQVAQCPTGALSLGNAKSS